MQLASPQLLLPAAASALHVLGAEALLPVSVTASPPAAAAAGVGCGRVMCRYDARGSMSCSLHEGQDSIQKKNRSVYMIQLASVETLQLH